MFKHYIFCRYNLTLFTENVYQIQDRDGWMERRLIYFSRTVNSLKKQTCQDFTFVLFIDKNTPKKHLSKIVDLLKGLDFVITAKGWEEWINSEKIKQEWVITSRIDNDDFYHVDFIRAIQEDFNGEVEVLDVHGMQIDTNLQLYTSGRYKPNSPFISLVEKSNNIKTVFEVNHSDMIQLYHSRFVSYGALYFQVIHDENVANKIIGIEI